MSLSRAQLWRECRRRGYRCRARITPCVPGVWDSRLHYQWDILPDPNTWAEHRRFDTACVRLVQSRETPLTLDVTVWASVEKCLYIRTRPFSQVTLPWLREQLDWADAFVKELQATKGAADAEPC